MNTKEMFKDLDNQEAAASSIKEQLDANPAASFAAMIQANPEMIMEAISMFSETAQSIQEIGPQIELLSRVTLARSFLQLTGGAVTFDAAAFERAWKYLSDNEPQTPTK